MAGNHWEARSLQAQEEHRDPRQDNEQGRVEEGEEDRWEVWLSRCCVGMLYLILVQGNTSTPAFLYMDKEKYHCTLYRGKELGALGESCGIWARPLERQSSQGVRSPKGIIWCLSWRGPHSPTLGLLKVGELESFCYEWDSNSTENQAWPKRLSWAEPLVPENMVIKSLHCIFYLLFLKFHAYSLIFSAV